MLVQRPLLSLVPGVQLLMFPKEDRSQSLISPVPYGACVRVCQCYEGTHPRNKRR